MSDGLPPPHDLDAEAAVLSAVLLDSMAIDEVPELHPEHFESEAHRRIFEACRELRSTDGAIDVVRVASWLRDRGRLVQVGGIDGVRQIADAAPVITRAHLRAHATTVREKARLRKIIATAQRVERDARGAIADVDAFIARDASEFSAVAAPSTVVEPWYVVEMAAEIAAPLPPVEWLCRELRIARGSVTLLGGYGYARKTLFAQALALAIASGARALGVFTVKQAAVVHVDYEQGRRITRERYQRMSRVASIDLAASRLHAVTFPRVRLTTPGARDVFRRMLETTEAGLIVIDSLRAAVSGVDENSSEIRECIDLLGQEVKRVDAAAILIHHARKPGDDKSAAKYSLRGSGAIFDAADELFMLSGEKGEPSKVEHSKDRLLGNELDTFGLNSEDVVGNDGNPRWGLRLVHLEPEQLRQLEERRRAASMPSVPLEGNGKRRARRAPSASPYDEEA